MSFEFEVPMAGPPSLGDLQAQLGRLDLWLPEVDLDDPGVLVDGLGVGVRGRSTRGVSLRWEDGVTHLRLSVLASAEDWQLARELVAAAIQLGGTWPVLADALVLEDLGSLEQTLGDGAHLTHSGAGIFRHMVDEGRGPLQVPGLRRRFFVGARLLAELENDLPDPPGDHLAERLIAACRQVQWMDLGGYFEANVFQVTPKQGEAFECAFWTGTPIFFPGTPYLMVESPGGDASWRVPAERLTEVDAVRFHYLDERQGLLDAGPEGYAAAVEALRAVAEPL